MTEDRVGAHATESEMPRYKCHKEVWALKIAKVVPSSKAGTDYLKPHTGTLIPENPRYGSISVSEEYMTKHSPKPGGYYVVYKDGYKSFSPAESFEEGYALIT